MVDLLDQRLQELNSRHRLQACFNHWAPLFTICLLLASLGIMAIRLSGVPLAWLEWPLCAAAALLPFLFLPKIWRRQKSRNSLAAELDFTGGRSRPLHGLGTRKHRAT